MIETMRELEEEIEGLDKNLLGKYPNGVPILTLLLVACFIYVSVFLGISHSWEMKGFLMIMVFVCFLMAAFITIARYCEKCSQLKGVLNNLKEGFVVETNEFSFNRDAENKVVFTKGQGGIKVVREVELGGKVAEELFPLFSKLSEKAD